MTTPPVAPRRSHLRTHHGDEVDDPYEWLRDVDDPETKAYLEAENAWTQERTAHLADLRATIVEEIRSRTQETDLSLPTRRGDWWYYSRTVEGQQYAIRCRCAVEDPDDWTPPTLEPGVDVPGEQVLLDSNAEADGHEFYCSYVHVASPLEKIETGHHICHALSEQWLAEIHCQHAGPFFVVEVLMIGTRVAGFPVPTQVHRQNCFSARDEAFYLSIVTSSGLLSAAIDVEDRLQRFVFSTGFRPRHVEECR